VSTRLKWLGTVENKKYLSHGVQPLTEEQREFVDARIDALTFELSPSFGDDNAKLVMVTEMLMTLAGGTPSTQETKAKANAYLYALRDTPAWAVRAAINSWYEGKARDIPEAEFRWPAAPAILRRVCDDVLQPFKDALADLTTLRDAKPLDETMKDIAERKL
jgi:hypothetical protein